MRETMSCMERSTPDIGMSEKRPYEILGWQASSFKARGRGSYPLCGEGSED
jgi:hypothetical protein